jgi:hypothetical protein
MQNLEHTIRMSEPGSILIIIFCGLKGIEKEEGGLQVAYTARSWS